MLVSHKQKFIFIHIQKTAGTSIVEYLKKFADCQSVLGTHDFAMAGRQYFGDEVWNSYFKFAFVRNPWDRLVSWYSMISSPLNDKEAEKIKLWKYVRRNSSNFEEFVYNCTGEIDDIDGKKSFLYNQLDYLSDGSGRLIVDFVGKYETLQSDFQFICEKIKVPYLPEKIPHVKHHSSREDYAGYYKEDLKEYVRQRYLRDINFFNYRFGEKI